MGANTGDITYRWVNGPDCTQAEWDKIDMLLATRGWISLNRMTSRILLAEDADGTIVGFHLMQLVPYLGPLFVIPSARGSGVADELVNQMLLWMEEMKARGFLVIAQSKHTERRCREIGMQPVESPVFMQGGTT